MGKLDDMKPKITAGELELSRKIDAVEAPALDPVPPAPADSGLYVRLPRRRSSRLSPPCPVVIKTPTENTGQLGWNRVGAVRGPAHAGPLATLAYDGLAAGLDHAGTDAQALLAELGVAHPGPVGLELPDAEPSGLAHGPVRPQDRQQVVEPPLLPPAAQGCPIPGSCGLGANLERFSASGQAEGGLRWDGR